MLVKLNLCLVLLHIYNSKMYHYNSNNSNHSSTICCLIPHNATHMSLRPALLVKPAEQSIVGLLVVPAEVHPAAMVTSADLTYPQIVIN